MNAQPHTPLRPRSVWRPLLIAWAAGLTPLPAFFPEPDPLILDVGTSAVVKVKGSSGGAAVNLTDVSNSGLVSDDLTAPRSGTGYVNVVITGTAPGTTTLFFSGTNNGQIVSGSIQVIVLAPAGTSAQNPQFGIAGDPVNTGTGEYFATEGMDMNLGGPMPLCFSRYVASSLSASDLVQAGLGTNRSHNFASRIISVAPTVKRVVLPSGRVLRFDKNGKNWGLKAPTDIPFQLVESSGQFLLGHPHTGQAWTYDANGRLVKIEDGRGNVHTLAYTGGSLTSVSDGLGRTLTLNYTGALITSITDNTTPRTVTFAYTGGVLTSVQDYGGHTTTYGSSGGRPSSVQRPEGNTPFTQAYTGSQVTTQVMRGTDTSTLEYNAGSTVFTDPELHTLTDFYDSNGRLTSHEDQLGRAVSMTYDNAGRRTSVTDRLGGRTSFTYHAASGRMASMTDAEGRVTLFAYAARKFNGLVFHDLVKVTRPDGASSSCKYDARGNLTQVTDEAGKSWKYTHDASGQVLTATNPLGAVTTYQYDAMGRLTSCQPPDEGVTTLGYDTPRGRLSLITRPGGHNVILAYDGKDRLTSVTDERGKVWTYAYNDNDRITRITDPDLKETHVSYDALDRVDGVTDRLGNATVYAYNSRGLLESVTDRNSNSITATYDERQMLTGLTDAGAHDWLVSHDREGRVINIRSPLQPLLSGVQYDRNRLGFPVRIRDADGAGIRIIRDAMQRVTGVVDPLGRQTFYGYDKRGLLINAARQGTGVAKYDRDALGNVTKITDPGGGVWSTTRMKSGFVSKNTDPLGRSTSYAYNPRGRLSSATFPDGTSTTLVHDFAGNLIEQVFTHASGPSLDYGYDNQNRLTSANEVTFEYDAEGRLSNCPQDGLDFNAVHDPGGRLTSVEYRNGAVIVTYQYDTRSRLVQVTDNISNADLDFIYADDGRLTDIIRTPGIDATFSHDSSGRLVRIEEGGIIDLVYTLNPAGEVIGIDYNAPDVPSVTASSQTFKFGKAGEITTPGHAYDALGRLTTSPGHTYEWNGVSNLVNADGVELEYNGLGHLIRRTDGMDVTEYQRHYAIRGAPIVFQESPGTEPDIAYVWTPGGQLLYSIDMSSGDTTFYHFDRAGSTLALTDEMGTVTDSYAYGPYGERLVHNGGSNQPFTYIGRHGVREEGGLYQMGARYYDPSSARFLSRDPLPPRLEDPSSLNRYAYAAGNPMKYIDPSGAIDEVSAVAADIANSGALGPGSIYMLLTMFERAFGLDEAAEREERARQYNMEALFRMQNMPPPPAPPANDIPAALTGAGTSGCGAFFPGPPGGPVSGLFPGGGPLGIHDGNGSDSLMDAPGGGLMPPGGFFGGGPGLVGSPGDDDISFGPGGDGGGIFNPSTSIPISNTTLSENTAEGVPGSSSQAASAAHQSAVQFFTTTYIALQAAGQQLLDDIVKNGGRRDKATRDKLSAIDKQRGLVGEVIRGLGGTVPPPPQ